MTEATLRTGLQEAMAGLADWRAEAESALTGRLDELDLEERRLRESIAQLEAELIALEALRAEVRAESGGLERAQSERAHQAMLEGLGRDRDALASRSVELAAAHEAATSELRAELEDPEIAALIAEYERFSEVEATLSALPESYRHAITTHHDSVVRRLKPIFERAQAAGPELDEPVSSLSVVACLELDEDGAPESLTFVLPVDSAVYSRWAEREEDLPTRLGYRVVALASKLAGALGNPAAPLTCRDQEGFLAVQLWLGDAAPTGDVREAAEAAAAETFAAETPLAAARLSAALEWLAPEVLDPPEDDGDDDEDDDDSDGDDEAGAAGANTIGEA